MIEPMPPAPTPAPPEKKRIPLVSALLSGLVIPGAGQIVNGDLKRGIFLIVVFLGSIVWFMKVLIERLTVILPGTPEEWKQNPQILQETMQKLFVETPGVFLTFELLMIMIWIYSIVDAYMSAKK